ncbi:hypothetical protein Tco_0586714 [Tanacetum coccineum]
MKEFWKERSESGSSSGKSNHRDNSAQLLQNNQKQGNVQAMITAPTDGKVSSGSLPLYERCFTRHVGPCTIKCYKCVKFGHKARKVKQEEVGEVRGRAYVIKDAELKGPNVVTGMFLLNNSYAFVLFDSGSDRSFVDTRFSSMLNIDLTGLVDPKEKENRVEKEDEEVFRTIMQKVIKPSQPIPRVNENNPPSLAYTTTTTIRVPRHDLDLWSLAQFFYDHVDDYTRMDLDFAADGNLRELSGEEAWEAIENFAQGQKEWDNSPNIISEQEIENLKVHAKRLFGNENVWVEMHRNIAWDKVENLNPQSTPQVLPSFEEYTPPVTYPEEVEETLGTR